MSGEYAQVRDGDYWNRHSRHGRKVDVVAHSIGGLITRYALAQVQRGHRHFPRRLLVEDVVTLGTPYGGSRRYAVCGLLQCGQMRAGSDFLVWLERNAWEPDVKGGTDWVKDLTSHWPVRRADLAVTFGNR